MFRIRVSIRDDTQVNTVHGGTIKTTTFKVSWEERDENSLCLLLKHVSDEMINTTVVWDSVSPQPFQEKAQQLDQGLFVVWL